MVPLRNSLEVLVVPLGQGPPPFLAVLHVGQQQLILLGVEVISDTSAVQVASSLIVRLAAILLALQTMRRNLLRPIPVAVPGAPPSPGIAAHQRGTSAVHDRRGLVQVPTMPLSLVGWLRSPRQNAAESRRAAACIPSPSRFTTVRAASAASQEGWQDPEYGSLVTCLVRKDGRKARQKPDQAVHKTGPAIERAGRVVSAGLRLTGEHSLDDASDAMVAGRSHFRPWTLTKASS